MCVAFRWGGLTALRWVIVPLITRGVLSGWLLFLVPVLPTRRAGA